MRDAYKPRFYDRVRQKWPEFVDTVVYDATCVAEVFKDQEIETNTAGTQLPHSDMWLEFHLSNPHVSAIGAYICKQPDDDANACSLYFCLNNNIVHGGSTAWNPLPFDMLDKDRIAEGTRQHQMFVRWNEFYRELRVLRGFDSKNASEIVESVVRDAWAITLLALRLLNCKNITTITREGPATINERRKREGKPPYTSYKVLKLPIGDETRYVNGNQNEDKNTGLTRLHIARGHFKTYTPENPLFGKCTGTYWWPQMVRGKKENGQVIKDYKLVK